MRSVEQYFPEARRVILAPDVSKLTRAYVQRFGGAEVRTIEPVDIAPIGHGKAKEMSFWRFNVSEVPGDYLVYIDADAFLTGRVEELLNVPSGKLGLVSEHHFGFTLRQQLDHDRDVSEVSQKYEVDLSKPSVNAGVIAGERDAWVSLWKTLLDAKAKRSILFELSYGNQGVVQPLLEKEDLSYELPRHCNELNDEKWDGVTSSVIHFDKWPRPWITGSPRRDNSYLSFAEWRKYSSIFDFTLNGTFLKESIWRGLDDIRPLLRRLKRKNV